MVRQASASSKMHWRSADLSTWNMRTWGSLRWSRCQLIDQNWSMRIPFSGLHQGRGMRSATWQQKKQLRSTELKNIEHIFIRFHQYLKNTSNTSNKDDHFWAPEMQKASPITARLAFKRTLAFVGWNTLKHAETMQRCWLLKGKLHSNIFTAVHNLGFFHAATHATQSSELHDCYLRLASETPRDDTSWHLYSACERVNLLVASMKMKAASAEKKNPGLSQSAGITVTSSYEDMIPNLEVKDDYRGIYNYKL